MPFGWSTRQDGQAQHDEELYELTEDGRLSRKTTKRSPKYLDGSSIDWLHEEAAERERTHSLRSQPGARGLLLPLLEASRLWFVVIMTGLGIGITGAWLDVLVKWYVHYCTPPFHLSVSSHRLGDLREGHCSYGFFYNQVACCSGLDCTRIFHIDTCDSHVHDYNSKRNMS